MRVMGKTALAIMAAGIGARYGGGIKQLETVGPNGELIIDYSIHDAVAAGFDKIVFIIRRDIESDFREAIGERVEKACAARGVEVAYAFQSLDDIPSGVSFTAGRTKPWGTGQAVLACKDLIQEPFAVINADDYYGKEAYRAVHDFLSCCGPDRPCDFCMAGFVLENTLSENGGVTRGVCKVDCAGYLSDVEEIRGIARRGDRAEGYTESLQGGKDVVSVPLDSLVSMNMWGLTPAFMGLLAEEFPRFFEDIRGNEQNAEFLIPAFIGKLLRKGGISVKVLRTSDRWLGITYREDLPQVKEAFRKLAGAGAYGGGSFTILYNGDGS